MKLSEIVRNELLTLYEKAPLQTLLVAVSGGVDSVVLLDLLAKLRAEFDYQLVVVHVHHGLRAEGADRDAGFVQDLALQYNCPFHLEKVAVFDAVKRTGESVETAARRLRYDVFFRLASHYDFPVVVTAHHQNDQAETVLDRLMRGTGVQGLGGISRIRYQGAYILARPLLQVPKEELIQYAVQSKLHYEEDETNTWTVYRRNRIRHELLPYMRKEFNPRIVQTLYHEAEIMQAENELVDSLAQEFIRTEIKLSEQGAEYRKKTYSNLPLALQRRVVKLVLGYLESSLHFGFEEIEEARQFLICGSGKRPLKGGFLLVVKDGTLQLERTKTSEYALGTHWTPTAVEGASFFSIRGLKWRIDTGTERPPSVFSRTLWEAWFNLQEGQNLKLRGWRQGDRIKLFGMKGSKLLSDLFIDRKVVREIRRLYPIFSVEDEVVWVPGLGRSRSCLVTANALEAVRVSVQPAMED